jgi:CO/xanthine dehydrogenase FAD-binding subunit
MLRPFRLEEPESVREVSELLGRFGESAKVYAGGTELLLAMKEGLIHYERLVNVKNVKGLNEVTSDNGMIRIGALSTHHQLETSLVLQQKLAALVQLEQHVANVRVRQVAYLKFGYLERPSVGVAIALRADGNGKSIHDATIAVGCAGPAPQRVPEAEEQIKGTSFDEAKAKILKAGEIAGRAAQAISDLHGSQEYKEHIVGVLLKRAFQNALSQC